MGLVTKEVEIKLCNNVKIYKDKGYVIPNLKENNIIKVKVEDLPKFSKCKVKVECDCCSKVLDTSWFTYSKCVKNGKYYCNDCSKKSNNIIKINRNDSIAITHPHLIKYFSDKDNAYKYTHGSNLKLDFICQDCGDIKNMPISDFVRRNFSCKKCSDNLSYSEKFIYSLLQQLNIDFKTQLGNTTFEWCGKYKYDFYVNPNIIIETHGVQHYKKTFETCGGRNLQEEQSNDLYKEQLALDNGINNYIVLDCRKSELEYIKNIVINSKLNKLFNLSNIDWLKCHEYSCKNLVRFVCDLFNDGYSVVQIATDTKLNRSTVSRYLKHGNKLLWCNYLTQ